VKLVAILLAVVSLGAAAPDLTGLWHGAFTAEGGEKRSLLLALRVEGAAVMGEVETPTRNAPLVEGKLLEDGFAAIAQSDWDGKLARRPIEGHLAGATLKVRVQQWPGGPVADYDLRRISRSPVIPRPRAIPPAGVKSLPYNGLAKTPPMGWSSWNKFGCRIDEAMVREVADAMVSTGMKDAGYIYVNIDDCWQGGRNGKGVMRSDPKRFPDMKKLADYVHRKGLKIGIYSSPGPKTCAGYDGSYGYEEQDAQTYAAWGIDYLKYDWCSAGKLYKNEEMRPVFQRMGAALQRARRPIVYSISQYGLADVWEWAPKAGSNLWRTTGDIGANWKSIAEIGFEKQLKLAPYAGPGHWNDPDMLEVGNGRLTAEEYRAHMALWAILAAPLLAGNDVRSMTPEVRSILLNREVIAVDQDPLGKQGTRALQTGPGEIWTKPMQDGSTVIGLFNRDSKPGVLNFAWQQVGLVTAPKRMRDLWRQEDVLSKAGDRVSMRVPPHGVILLRVWSR
jgi:alpha-galactosidase